MGLLRNNKDAVLKVESLLNKGEELFTSSINLHELIKGANLSNDILKNTAKVNELMQTISILPFDRKCAVITGKISAKKEIRTKPIGQNDIFIGAVAVSYNLKLITKNKKHFSHIPNLEIEEW